MSAVDSVPPASSAKTARRKSSKSKRTGPSVSDLILKAVSASKDRRGMSLFALKKALSAGGYNVAKNNSRVVLAVRRLVANGSLLQVKGTGASGSFKIGKKQPAGKKKAVKKAKKPRAKKTKRVKAKKSSVTKKSPKKARRKSSSPKKAKRPAAVQKSRSPRKVKRRVSKPKSPGESSAESPKLKAAPKKRATRRWPPVP
ncbi:LOW QUALITY PROTEIN: histone H1 [Chanos chanos]|uniref:LOW QUALITY PROTEIN: histone H1 n=1 Tax=Chanos chanos TaxID=29144 RepID=A0AC58UVT5_CHACN